MSKFNNIMRFQTQQLTISTCSKMLASITAENHVAEMATKRRVCDFHEQSNKSFTFIHCFTTGTLL